jgi:ketosteroid isomerase-like protein
MPRENVEIVRRLYAWGPEVQSLLQEGGDLSRHPWLSLWHPECVLAEIAGVPDSAAYHGREGVARYFENAFTDVWDEQRYTPEEIVEGNYGVVAATDIWGRSKVGAEVEMRVFQVFRIPDGMIVFAAGYLDRQQALDAVGLSE